VPCCGADPREGIPSRGARAAPWDPLGLLYAVLLAPGAGGAARRGTRCLPLDSADLLEAPGLCPPWGRWRDQAFTAWMARAPQSCGAPVPSPPRREPGLGSPSLPCTAPAPAAPSPGDPLFGAATGAFRRSNVPSSPSEHDGCRRLRHSNAHAARSRLRHLSGINP